MVPNRATHLIDILVKPMGLLRQKQSPSDLAHSHPFFKTTIFKVRLDTNRLLFRARRYLPPAGPSLNGQYTTTSSVMPLYCKTYFTILSIFLHQCHSKIAELEPRNPLRKYNITIFCQNHIIMIAKCIFYDKNNTGAIGIIGSNSYELTRYCLIFHTIGKIGFCLYVIISLRMLFSVNLQITLFNMIITNDPFQHDHLNVRLFL